MIDRHAASERGLEVEDAQSKVRGKCDVLRLTDVKALGAERVERELAGPSHRRKRFLLPLLVDDPPLDVVHRYRVSREQQGVVFPRELGVLAERTLLEYTPDAVHDLEDALLAQDRMAHHFG